MLRPMIRVRCLWLRSEILAERAAREKGSTRSAYLETLRAYFLGTERRPEPLLNPLVSKKVGNC
jgi:hypothetical protein